MKNERLTLLELNSLVREAIECKMPNEYWVEAELSECRESRGHCYMELIQKDDLGATPVAKASAKCWASKWVLIRPYFERTTGQALHAGMKVLLRVYPQFHEAYGFSWIVTDIDPTYTMGDMARKRQDIIRQLKQEGVFDLQKELKLPMFCLHVAVISSQSAAGYGDFCNQLADSPFAFQTRLFPATMQGEGVEKSIIAALNRIYQAQSNHNSQFSIVNSQFDCVVIIRGGGATSDMSGFDTLALAENVANFPLPIITGIGHDRDESILDMVSHQRVKTPTAAAAFLIDHAQTVLDALNNAQNRVVSYTQQRMSSLKLQVSNLSAVIPRLFSVVKTPQEAKLNACEQRIPMLLERRLITEHHRLELAAEKLKMLDPQLLLRRGYSITLKDGRAVRDPQQLSKGDILETRLEKGTIKTTVI